MALINCPDCNTEVSDKAVQCPRCAYPISFYFNKQATTTISEVKNEPRFVPQQNLNSNLAPNQHLYYASKKSEATAIIFTFLFGPLGLLYASVQRAVILILCSLVAFILIFAISTRNPDGLIIVLSVLTWIISIVLSVSSVSQYNSKLLETPEEQNINAKIALDPVERIRQLIRIEKDSPFYAESKSGEILDLLETVCGNKESAASLFYDYNSRFNRNLIDDLKSLTTSYSLRDQYLSKFIEYDFPGAKSRNR